MTDLFEEEPKKAAPKRARKSEAPAAEPAQAVNVEESVGALVETTRANPIAVFTDGEQFSVFHQRLKEEVAKHVPDLTTDRGRKAIASLAFKVTKSKTALVAAGKTLTEDARAMIAKVNASSKQMESELDALAKETRRPLTEWEDVEKARIAANTATLGTIRSAAQISEDDTSATVAARGREIYEMAFDEPQWVGDEAAEAIRAKEATVAALLSARDRLKAKEAEAAELEELRREKAEREERERVEREAREAIEAKQNYARLVIEHIRQVGLGMIGGQTYPYVILLRELEEKIETGAAAEGAFGDMAGEVEQVRVQTLAAVQEAQRASEERAREKAAQEAADKARADAEAAAAAEQRKRDEAHAQQLREAQEERDRIAREAQEREETRKREDAKREADAQAERDRVAAEQKKRDDEAAEKAEADRVRQANQAHRREVMGEAADDIMAATGIEDREVVRKVVLAVASGQVRHCEVLF